jgi:hypothetical protein
VGRRRQPRSEVCLLRRLLREGQNIGTFGPKELEITDAALVGHSLHADSTLAWAAVERVAENKRYAFIYISATEAYVIPRAKVKEGDYDSFVEAVKQKLAARAALCPSSQPGPTSGSS